MSYLQAVLTEHTGEVVGVALHPTNKYFITASADKTWAFYDLDTMLCMAQVRPWTHAGGRFSLLSVCTSQWMHFPQCCAECGSIIEIHRAETLLHPLCDSVKALQRQPCYTVEVSHSVKTLGPCSV